MKSVVNIFVLALSALGLLAACDSYEREEVTHNIFVNKNAVTLTVGQSDTLIVSPTGGQARWASESADIATVDNNGVVTAPPLWQLYGKPYSRRHTKGFGVGCTRQRQQRIAQRLRLVVG